VKKYLASISSKTIGNYSFVIMLNEFRQAYPRGSLISELINIYQGKYLVRVLAIVDDVTLATGLAAEDTLEMAEDRARLRALGAISFEATLHQAASRPVVSHQPSAGLSGVSSAPGTSRSLSSPRNRPQISDRPQSPDLANLESEAIPRDLPSNYGTSEISDPREEWLVSSQDYYSLPKNQNTSEDISAWSTPPKSFESFDPDREFSAISGQAIAKRAGGPLASSPSPDMAPAGADLYSSYPVATTQATETMTGEDVPPRPRLLSDDERKQKIAQTTVEIQRLGWDNTQGREFLQGRYNKRARSQLSDEELLDFLHYLQTQSNPT
jgi:hypothetical protein